MRALVTGGAGFIGSHLVDRLLEAGAEVLVLDNFSTGRPENLEDAKNGFGDSLQIIDIDVADAAPCRGYFRDVDWVFHLAALADIVPSIQQPLGYHDANVNGTVAVLEAARHAGVSRFVYAASSSCYGVPDVYPTPEDAPIQPQYPYALTKYLGELAALHWSQVYELPVVSLRLFNVFGPRARTSGTYGAVMGVFIAQHLAGRPLTIVGDGTQTRDFVYVDDVARAFVAAAESNCVGAVMNVGSSRPMSVNRLAELIGGETVHIPKRPGEPDCTHADIGRIVRELDWEPTVAFEDGVEKVLEHKEYWRDAVVWTPDTIADATRDWFQHLGDRRQDGNG
jgi:UDP-glucose 4-epimerase